MHLFLETTVLLITFHCLVGADPISEWVPRVPGLDESVDEVHDAEIFRAVVTSMEQWKRKHRSARVKRSQPNSVCYDQLGCFEDSGPFGYLEMLPSAPQEINTRFLLYSTKSRGDIPLLDVPFSNMTKTWQWADRAFNTSSPTKVIVHGFGSNCDHVWVYEMRSALMAVEECNVICVDWEAGAVIPNYVRAAANTRLVGKQLAMLLEGLADHINLKFENVHLIGFSLGAHVAGFAGSELKNISRITGLDPAGPLFEAQDPRVRLDSSDAAFVDVIHSNGENLILGGLGSWQPMGHVDFYPNGGRMQTGCSNLFVGAVTDIIWSSNVEARSLCNHRRAYKFFTDSVSPKCHFPSFPCESYDDFLSGNCFGCTGDKRCGNMGYYADRSKGRGQLYLLTRDEEPFCAHQYHVKVESGRSNKSLVSYGKIMMTLVGDSGLNETFPMTKKDDSELILGSTISRMLVPHPALGVPIQAELVYQAYTGWISSGLSQWTVDKVMLTDSFGKTSSVCKRGLVLKSGVPVMLPLYPGECHNPEVTNEKQNKSSSTKNQTQLPSIKPFLKIPTFIPTQVVKIGNEILGATQQNSDTLASSSVRREDVTHANKNKSEKLINSKNQETNVIPMGQHFKIENENKTSDPLYSILEATDILTLPWQPLLANSLDNTPNERESGRAFGSINTQMHSFSFFDTKSNKSKSEFFSEIVEPILKLPSAKNARSHDNEKTKLEITEPILGSTKLKVNAIADDRQSRTNRTPKTFEISPVDDTLNVDRSSEATFNDTKWVPSYKGSDKDTDSDLNAKTSKREDEKSTTQKSDTFSIFQWNKSKRESTDEQNNSISSFTVQFLPSRLVSFLEKAERYARNTILPLVSAYTPRFLLFGQDKQQETKSRKIEQKYVPLKESDQIEVIPKQTQQEKIDMIKNIQPPTTTDNTINNTIENDNEAYKQIAKVGNVKKGTVVTAKDYANPNDHPIKVVKAPDVTTTTTTTLSPVTLQMESNSSEKIIIVYPSNARDDRKIQSHSYPEIMQFESLYQQSLNKNPIAEESKLNIRIDTSREFLKGAAEDHGVHIDLPTYSPPTETTPYPYKKTTPKFIPVSYPPSAAA